MSQDDNILFRQRLTDPDGLVGAIRGSELEPLLLSGHGRTSELSRLMLPGSCLDQTQLGPAIWFEGRTAGDCYTLVYVTACPGGGHSFNFNARHRDRCLGFFAPGATLDGRTPEGYRQSVLTIPAAVFQQAAAGGFPEIPEELLSHGGAIFPKDAACGKLSRLLAAVEETLRSAPETLRCEVVRGALERELHEDFFDLIRAGGESADGGAGTAMTRRYQRIRRVRDFIREHSHRRILLEELCGVSGLSRRGLEYLFLDLLGVRPKGFLLRSRLHGVRRELLAAEPGQGLVKRCALNWGFWHLGRFAAEYQSEFGEPPSATLARRR